MSIDPQVRGALLALLVTGLAGVSPRVCAQATNFGEHVPTVREWEDALERPAAGPDAGKTRTLTAHPAGPLSGAQRPGDAMNIAPRPDVGPGTPSASVRLQFDFDSARLRPQSVPVLENLAKAMQGERLTNSRFAIVGHTDASGSLGYNMTLSKRRADTVREFLLGQGVAQSRLATQGKGPTQLLDPSHPGAATNRRVEIDVTE
jgi:OOP family OmpA-OmpF porin